MAKMIPSIVPLTTPQSERGIFDRLRLDPGAADWTVLHSLGLARTRVKPYGEIDFVIMIPGKGLVCLEVKGGLVSCREGIWITTNQRTGVRTRLTKSPYLQAREGMFALKKAIEDKFGRYHPAAGCAMSYAVVFPAVSGLPRSPGEEPWETIDLETLRAPISRSLVRNIDGTRRKLPAPLNADSTTPETMAIIRQFLRPDFDCVISRASTIRQAEERIVALTEAQYNYLDLTEVNDRVLVTGAAGTGKTLLAIEFARRETAKGRKVLFLCYNKTLADWLRRLFAETGIGNVRIGSFHSVLREAIADSSYGGEFEKESDNIEARRLFSEIYPLYAELALTERGPLADTLIIDEAQDLLVAENLGVLNQIIIGGLAGGRWGLFGDFNHQAIYSGLAFGGYTDDRFAGLDAMCPAYVKLPLRINCRNTRSIGEETALLSGFESLPYRLAEIDGPAVDYRYWSKLDDERMVLETVLRQILKDGVSPDDVVILSPSTYEKSAAALLQDVDGIPIVNLRDRSGQRGKEIVFSTIHSFKGMESPVVVMCGIADVRTDQDRALTYVGMSRARSQLVMVVSEKVRKLMPELTRRRLAENWEG